MNLRFVLLLNRLFLSMLFYFGQCSLFLSVYATTASNSEESSYACYYSSKYHTYLGDVYSVNWMEDSDAVSQSVANVERSLKSNEHILFLTVRTV